MQCADWDLDGSRLCLSNGVACFHDRKRMVCGVLYRHSPNIVVYLTNEYEPTNGWYHSQVKNNLACLFSVYQCLPPPLQFVGVSGLQ